MARGRPVRSSARGVGKLAATSRNFAYPRSKSYPINTLGRARSALSRASSSGNRGTYQHVARAVRARWGNRVASVGTRRGTVSAPGYRRGR